MTRPTAVKNGRPLKISLDDKKTIVDWYEAVECNGDPSLLKAHGVYTRIAIFARNCKMLRSIPNIKDVKDTDFSKDAQIRAYMDQLIEDGAKKEESAITESAYVPLDVEAIVRQSPRAQRNMLTQYNEYNQRVYLQASKAVEEHNRLCQRVESLQSTVNNLMAENQSVSSELNAAEKEKAALKHRIRVLNEIIDNMVTPTQRELIDQQSTEERLAYAASLAVSDLSFMHKRIPTENIASVEFAETATAVVEDSVQTPDELKQFLVEFGLTKEE